MHQIFERYLAEAQRQTGVPDERSTRRLTEATAQLQTALAQLMAQTVTAADPRGYVDATATLAGRLQGVRITPQAWRDLTAPALGTACVEAIRAARAKAMAEFTEQIGEPPADLVADPLAPLRRAGY